ncbi:MAG: hypothetical protein IJY06_06440 [Oscillospiraceae bacterium]|nr:hypothetical protein [Oscillospiraceae bacterium]
MYSKHGIEDIFFAALFEWMDRLWESVSLPAILIRDLLNGIFEPVLRNAGGIVYFNLYPKSWVSLVADIFYLLINAAVLIFGYLLYVEIRPQNGSRFFVVSNVLMSIGTLMPFVGIKVYEYIDTTVTGMPVKTENVLKIIIPAVLFVSAIIMVGFMGVKLISNKGIGGFCLILVISQISHGTILILFPIILLLICLFVALVLAILGIIFGLFPFWLPFMFSTKRGNRSSSTSVPPQHRRETNRSGVSIGVNGETYTRDNQGRVYDSNGNYVKTHLGFDGKEYVGDKYTPRLYDDPKDQLY